MKKNNIQKIFNFRNILITFLLALIGLSLKTFICKFFNINVFRDFYSIQSIVYYLFMAYLALKFKSIYSLKKLIILFLFSLSIRILVWYFSDYIPENLISTFFSIEWLELIYSIFSRQPIFAKQPIGCLENKESIIEKIVNNIVNLMESFNNQGSSSGDGSDKKRGRELSVGDSEKPRKRSRSNYGEAVKTQTLASSNAMESVASSSNPTTLTQSTTESVAVGETNESGNDFLNNWNEAMEADNPTNLMTESMGRAKISKSSNCEDSQASSKEGRVEKRITKRKRDNVQSSTNAESSSGSSNVESRSNVESSSGSSNVQSRAGESSGNVPKD